MKKANAKDVVTAAEFAIKVEAAEREIRSAIADYANTTLIISALDGAIHSTWSALDAPVRLICRDRFPELDGSTPDFLFGFSNGYSLVGEYKGVWDRQSGHPREIKQLTKYKNFDLVCKDPVDEPKATRSHDVLLIVGSAPSDEAACEEIAKAPELGSGSVVVSVAYKEMHIANRAYVRFGYYKHGGQNGAFAPTNAGPTGTKFDLNTHFVGAGGFPALCDEQAILEAGECPFVNDRPPETYTLVQVLLPLLNSLLLEGERDAIATSNNIGITFTEHSVTACAATQYPRVSKKHLLVWVKAALRELLVLGVATAYHKDGVTHYELRLDDKLQKLEESRLITKLARGRVSADYVPVKRQAGSDQWSFDFDSL